jgi:hypothetical protein
MWYSGGTLTPGTPARKWGRPNHRAALARAAKARAAGRTWGRAVWHTLPWCFHAVATAMGLEGFAYACYDAPDFVATAMARVEECNRKAILAIPRRDRPDFFLLDGDCAYRTGLMIDAGMLRKFTLEPTRRTLDLLAELEIPCAFHSDGRLRDLLPYLIELGIRAVHGCESMANDLGELVSEFGDSIVLCGNMDVVFLKNSTPEQVRRSALAMLKTGSAKGRYIAGCNTSPLDYIPAENYVALTRTVQEFARRWASTARRLPRASPMQVSQAP